MFDAGPRKKRIHDTVIRLVFALYIMILLYFTFFSEGMGRVPGTYTAKELRYNLTPFAEIKRFWIYRKQLGVYAVFLNLAGNVLAFIPEGVMLPLMSKRAESAVPVFTAGFLTSFIIECTQIVFSLGSFDVDDIILNVAGVMSGYLIWLLFRMIAEKRREKRNVGIRRIIVGSGKEE